MSDSTWSSEAAAPHRLRSRIARWSLLHSPGARAFLRLPLFYKVVLGNALFVAAGLVSVLALVHPDGTAPLLTPVGLSVLVTVSAFSLIFNGLLVSLALRPLSRLEETARRVDAGDLSARAPLSPLADRSMGELVRVFNHMLDSLETLRRRHRRLAVRALEAEERERARISARLLDDTAQALATVLLRLRIAGRAERGPARPEALEALRREVVDILTGVRKLARELRPPEVDEVGLVAALEAQARALSEATGLEIRVSGRIVEGSLSWPMRVSLFRVLQEALENAVRHSRSGTIEVRLDAQGGRLRAEVRDEGIGFELDAVTEAGGLGLFEVSERVALLGGQATIESTPGVGTRVTVDLPLGEPAVRRTWP